MLAKERKMTYRTDLALERKEILEVTEVYHKYHNEVIQNGDLYRLISPFETLVDITLTHTC